MGNAVKISAVIITFNEEKYIEQCIRSVIDVVDEVIIVDSLSADRTPEICRSYNVKFIEQPFLGYRQQKNFALEQAQYDYILSLDADEALSVELRNSILQAKQNWQYDGYRCSRLNNYCGQWMYHTSLYPERKIRLFDRRKGSWGGINPHDRFELTNKGKLGDLKGDLLHWVYDDIQEHIAKINSFSSISAQEYFNLGIKGRIDKVIFRPAWRFIHSYIIKTGFLDGFMGFVASKNIAYLCYLKYSKLRALTLAEKRKKNEKKRVKEKVKIADSGWGAYKAGHVFEDNQKLSLNIDFPYKVSVIMTTFNHPQWLEKVIWGFESQTFKNFELVIADDGSGPETKAVIDRYIANSKLDIKHVWHEDEGFRKCQILNKGIVASTGQYLIFTDGDCIPRNDFIETHLRFAKPRHILSGGAIRLPMDLSLLIQKEFVYSQIAFERKWLVKNGLRIGFKSSKLIKARWFGLLMNRVTTAKATWNGGNSSGWKEDILAVNGYNEELAYGGLDRELGERLMNNGVSARQIRYSAICLHLDHPRPYKKKDLIVNNKRIRKDVRREKRTWAEKGITSNIPSFN